MITLLQAVGIVALFVLLPLLVMRSKRWPTWKQYFTYEKECLLHAWDYSDPKTFRQCDKCNRKQYRVYTDSGLLSSWLELR
jgi:hypothetical protein